MQDGELRREVPEGALAAWQQALGSGAVLTEEAAVGRYARSVQPYRVTPGAILYPENLEQVRELVRIAGEYHVPVYPLSCGKNWGYGDACPLHEGGVIIDFARMRGILELNTDLGYVVIEPGVTQQQLYEYVREHAPQYWMDSSGAGPEASVLGNILERGFGHTPLGDHARSCCGMEVVLGDGQVLSTGLCRFAGARAAHVYPYGVGPFLDGLFMQSSLGIVTKIGVWLLPAPEAFRFFYVRVRKDEALEPVIDRLRDLRMRGVLTSAVHVGNDLRIFTSHQRYPWDATAGRTPLPDPVRAALRKQWNVSLWNVSGSLVGSKGAVRSAARDLRKAMAGLGSVIFMTDRRLVLAEGVVGVLQRFGLGVSLARALAALRPNYGLLKGVPTRFALRALQWRVREARDPESDPLDTPCGLLWISPAIPATGADARMVLRIIETCLAKYGFDAPATFTFVNERSLVGIFNISFDKTVPGEGDAALKCYDECMGLLLAAGYPPYRVSPRGMGTIWDETTPFCRVVQGLKDQLDPQGILAPGRYGP